MEHMRAATGCATADARTRAGFPASSNGTRAAAGALPARRPRRRDGGWTQGRADALIALVSLAWGSSYLLMKVGLGSVPPFYLVALRFGIAFLAVALLFARQLRRTTARTLARSAVLGVFLFGLFAFLMHGLETTSASNAGFLTSLTVVLVPVLHALARRRMPARPVVVGALLALAGIALLSFQGTLAPHPGDALCIAGALSYAVHILLTDRFARRGDALLLGVWQLGFAALYGLACSFAFETPVLPATGAQWGAVLGLALVCSAFGFVAQPVAQRHTTPEHTGMLFALEPVSSAAFAFAFLGETLSVAGVAGAALVLAGVLVASEVLGKPRRAQVADNNIKSEIYSH